MRASIYEHRSGRRVVPDDILNDVIGVVESINPVLSKNTVSQIKTSLKKGLEFKGWSGEYRLDSNSKITISSYLRGIGMCLQTGVDNVNLTGWLAEEHAKHLWIPVTERLPKENGFYLCLYKHKASGGVAMDEGLSILQWINNKWGINDIYLVTHWMPIPQPPKEG